MDYYIIQDQETKGAYTLGQLKSMWDSGTLTAESKYCQEGYSEWLPLSELMRGHEPSTPSEQASGHGARIGSSGKRTRRRLGRLGVLAFLGIVLLAIVLSLANSGDSQQQLLEAAASLRNGRLTEATEVLNQIVSEHPSSPEGEAVRYMRSFLRETDPANGLPLTEEEANRLAELLILYEKTGVGKGLEDLAYSMARIKDMRTKARREILDEMERSRRER